MSSKKRTVIISKKTGAHVPAWGRLGPGVHPDLELEDEQIASIRAQGGQVLTAAEYKKQQKQEA